MPSFEQNKKNRLWSVRFRLKNGVSSMNKRLSGFQTKREATQAYNDFTANAVPDVASNENYNLTMRQLFGLYVSYITARVKVSTLYTVENEYKNHISPTFADINISDITKRDIFAWQALLNNAGYKYKTKSKLRGFLSSIFKFAVRYYDLPSNPVALVEPFRKVNEEKKEMQVWSFLEFEKFISVVTDNEYRALFFTLYYTGCRKSEAFALTWKDIDFETCKINFSKTLTRKVKDKPYEVLATPKSNASNRKILMPQQLISILQEYKKQIDSTSKFVFGTDKPLAENTVRRTLQRYIKIAGVKAIHEHEFRHSHASLLISQGASIVLVSKRLGHASVEETLNTYSHLMPDDEEKIVKLLEII